MTKEVKTTTILEGFGNDLDIVVKADDFDINKKYLIWNFLKGGKSMLLGSQYLKISGIVAFKGKGLSYMGKLLFASAPVPNEVTPVVNKIQPTEIEVETANDISLYNMFGTEFFSKFSYLSINSNEFNKITDNLLRDTYLKVGEVNKIKLY